LTTLKIEDLEEGKRATNTVYNPVWKLQITDDKNKIQYEGKFIDRNTGDFNNPTPPPNYKRNEQPKYPLYPEPSRA
jgi:hypothetical protein